MGKKKINLGMYSDDTRKMFIQYEGDKFYVMHQDLEGMNEVATEYSFESFIKTYKFMKYFFEELCLNEKEVVSKLSKIKKFNSKTNLSYV